LTRRFGARGSLAADDLLQAGFLGLLEAARAFDSGRGVPFIAYARPRIEGAMLDLLGADDPLSKRQRRARRERAAVAEELTARHGRRPTVEELASALGTTAAELGVTSTSEPTLTRLEDELASGQEPAAPTPDPESVAARQELARAVGDCLGELRPEMQLVVTGRMLDGLTLETLAVLWQSSKDRIWRLERAARRLLQTCLERKGWESLDAIDAAGG
jgi:RNA polymerase sigma factor for flagellar operon FliA